MTRVEQVAEHRTGAAYITVAQSGENIIIVDSGANATVDAFTGALASLLAQGLDLSTAVRASVVAGSAVVEAKGTTNSYFRDISATELARRAPARAAAR